MFLIYWHQKVPFLCFGNWKLEWCVRTGPVKGQVLSSGFHKAVHLSIDLRRADIVLCWSSRRSCLFQWHKQHNSSLCGGLSLSCLHMAACHAVVEFLKKKKKMWFSNPAHYCFFNMSVQARNVDRGLSESWFTGQCLCKHLCIVVVKYCTLSLSGGNLIQSSPKTLFFFFFFCSK